MLAKYLVNDNMHSIFNWCWFLCSASLHLNDIVSFRKAATATKSSVHFKWRNRRRWWRGKSDQTKIWIHCYGFVNKRWSWHAALTLIVLFLWFAMMWMIGCVIVMSWNIKRIALEFPVFALCSFHSIFISMFAHVCYDWLNEMCQNNS